MECGRCGEWIHAHCESLNNEHYQILSYLPDSVEYVCRTCLLEASSNWLDAVSNELWAGCEAVMQSLLNSKCAKHLFKREAQKLSSATSPLASLSCLPTPSATCVQKKMELLGSVKGGGYLEPMGSDNPADSSNPLHFFGHVDGKLPPGPDGIGDCVVPSEDPILLLEKSLKDGVDACIKDLALCQETGGADTVAASVPRLGEGDQTLAVNQDLLDSLRHQPLDERQHEKGIELPQTDGHQSQITDIVKEKIQEQTVNRGDHFDSENRLGGTGSKSTSAENKDDTLKENTTTSKKQKPERRHTRYFSSLAAFVPPDLGMCAQSDAIKLKECSVRLEDICKSRSASTSPKYPPENDCDENTKQSKDNLDGVGAPPPFDPFPQTDSNFVVPEGTVPSSQPGSNALDVRQQQQGAVHCDREPEKSIGSSLHSLMNVKEAVELPCLLGTDVSCTQVDGPNDETTTASHVMRNLFYEDRSLSVLESTSTLLDKKSEALSKEKKNNDKVILENIENQLISPKDKITKDIDDDCVSSEASSYCDTDTDIESIIQDDPDEPKDLLGVRERLRDGKYQTVLQFHVDTTRVIESGRHLNRGQTRNVLATYAKHMKECFPWFDIKMANIFELVDKKRPFPSPHSDHIYSLQSPFSGGSPNHHLNVRDSSLSRKQSISPTKGPDRRKCALCGREGDDEPNFAGRLLYLGQDEWMHINCGLWSSEVYEEVDGGLQNVYLAVNRGRLVKCSTCQERGATVGCCHKTCQATYHFMCARRSYCQFMEDKRIYCPVHMSAANGEEKSDDFQVNRCVYVDMDSEKKKWKQVPGNRVNIIIGSLVIRNLGRIVQESDSAEALIPVDFTCSRKYWSTVDPTKQVTYTCRTKKVVPSLEDMLSGDGASVNIHKTIDHSKGEEVVEREMAAVRKWFKHLEESKVEKKSRETNIIPPHLCPLYRSIKEKEEVVRVSDAEIRCRTPPAFIESDVRQCIEDIIDKVSRSVEEESLLFDNDLPPIVSADDNELISMVLNDLDDCDPITLHSTPSTSGRPSPLDMDFLSTCDHMMDSGKEVSHSGNLSQENVGHSSQVLLDNDTAAVALTPPPPTILHPPTLPHQTGLEPPQIPPSLHHLTHHDSSPTSPFKVQPPLAPVMYKMQPPLVPSSTDMTDLDSDVKEPIADIVDPLPPPPPQQGEHLQQHLGSVPLITSLSSAKMNSSSSSNVTQSSSTNTSSQFNSSSSESKGDLSNSSSSSSSSSSTYNDNNTSSSSTGGENSSPERSIGGTLSNTSSPDSCRGPADNLTHTDSNSDSSHSSRCNLQNSGSLTSTKSSSALKQICRVLPMPSTTSGRRSSSASEHSDTVSQDHSPPTSRRSPRTSADQDGRGNERKKICMKRNYKTVIKKYPLRSGMRKSKPYETVQIEINETIEIPRSEGSGVVRKSLKRKWSGILDSDEEPEEERSPKDSRGLRGEHDGQELESTQGASDEENGKENSVSKKVLKFSDDNSDITVSIVNNNNNLCEFSKSRVHKYRHRTVLQLDGAADGSSSSAEMSESQDEGATEEGSRNREDDTHTPPLHSALAMRIKEQSLARSSPGEEGPYKCSKCKRLYR